MPGNINCNTHAPEQELKCLPTDKQGRQKPFPPTQFYKDGPSTWHGCNTAMLHVNSPNFSL